MISYLIFKSGIGMAPSCEEVVNIIEETVKVSGVEEYCLDQALIHELLGREAVGGGEIAPEILSRVINTVESQDFQKKHGAPEYRIFLEQPLSSGLFHSLSETLKVHFPECTLILGEMPAEDWNQEWKKHYRPIECGKFIVIPEWLKDEYKIADSLTPVYINPGMGFGTGTHETTWMCLHELSKISKSFQSCLDFGCGSGILGIGFQILNPQSKAILYDIDLQALENAKYNMLINGVSSDNCYLKDPEKLDSIDQCYDLVFANILSSIIIEWSDFLDARTSQYLILSGILHDEVDEVKRKFRSKKLSLIEETQKNDWMCLVYQRKA